MSTTKEEISNWFDRGLSKNAKYMLIVCDTFDYEDYPIFFNTAEECMLRYNNPGSMQRVMEVYDLTLDKKSQLNSERCFKLPKNE